MAVSSPQSSLVSIVLERGFSATIRLPIHIVVAMARSIVVANGVVECQNHIVVAMVRSILLARGIPGRF
jgi:hypothetical protein